MGFFLLMIVIVLIAGSQYLISKQKSFLLNNLQIIERESKFFTKKEVLFANVSYNELAEAIMEEGFSNPSSNKVGIKEFIEGQKIQQYIKITDDRDRKAMFFKAEGSYGWTASLKQINAQEEGNTFEFMFESWRERNKSGDDIGMNYLLTTIEKCFLRLDSDTVFELIEGRYKTKYH